MISGNCLPLRGGYPGALFVAEVPFPRVGHSLSQSVDQSRWRRKAKVQGNANGNGKMKVKGEAKVGSDKQVRIIQHCKMMDRERGNVVSDIMDQIQARIKEALDLEKPASRPVNRSVSRPAVSQSAIRPVGQPAVSQSTRQSVTQSGGQSASQTDRH